MLPPSLPRGIPAASLEAGRRSGWRCSPGPVFRGEYPAASLKLMGTIDLPVCIGKSSAGNTRGLIEARPRVSNRIAPACLPRGIPAASLKPISDQRVAAGEAKSSAGNTRGLIEARDVQRREGGQR